MYNNYGNIKYFERIQPSKVVSNYNTQNLKKKLILTFFYLCMRSKFNIFFIKESPIFRQDYENQVKLQD